ncbi:MAG: PD40 domain-containing protein, partial [Planctomycetes bacterium]|nr:PD40 domain-containing protein [Planctomycetota bacterium]
MARWSWIALVSCALSLSTPADAQPLIWPGEPISTIETEHLRVFVPREHTEALKSLAARAEQLYARMIVDAGYAPRGKLAVLVSDWVDDHNGYSFVVPFPLVQVELAPALQESTIFTGDDVVERTLIHEFAHHISNDRNHGFRRGLELVFGRVLPNDIVSLLLFYLSTPSHPTMPRFWHEGLGTWAESHYARTDSVWKGRGQDPLIHMVWRLDAADDAVPEVGDWRITEHHWPYGNTVYIYGLAYTRYLQALLGDRISLWEIVREQTRSWPFFFNRGTRRLLGTRHRTLIEDARESLTIEQQSNLERIRGAGATELRRRTPEDLFVGAPAWQGDAIVFTTIDPYGRPRIRRLLPDGQIETTWSWSHALGNIRTIAGTDELVYHEYDWRRYSRIWVGDHWYGRRLLQPDVSADGERLAAIQFGGGEQRLVVDPLDRGASGEARVIATDGLPWSPTFRPVRGSGDLELVWVETDRTGSRLVLAPLRDPSSRAVIFEGRGRILHPAWSADGSSLFFCSDHTGVSNAYCVTWSEAGEASVVPVTNTIGGVTACVPSPDGRQLALVEHDRSGPFIATMPSDRRDWATEVPEIDLSWPGAIFARDVDGVAPSFQRRRGDRELPLPSEIPASDPELAARLDADPYFGILEVRPQFWMPTTAVVPSGGFGVLGVATDPLLTNIVTGGIGAGLVEAEVVGQATYTNLAHRLEWGLSYTRSERTYYDDVVATNFHEFDYTETVDEAEVRIGRGIFARERRFRAYASAGLAEYSAEHDSR